MDLCAFTAVLLVLCIVVTSEPDQDQLMDYGPHRETLFTAEGREETPEVNRERSKRFLTFNNDESNIRIEMVFAILFLQIPIGSKAVDSSGSSVSPVVDVNCIEMVFAIPFLQIPIGSKAVDSSGSSVSPVVDVNAKSLIVASVLLFMLFVVVPKLVRVFVPESPLGRDAGGSGSEWERMARGVEDVFRVNATACWQQGLCALVQSSRENSAGWAKVVDGLSSVWWVERLAEGTLLGEAMSSAKQEGDGCIAFYSQCPLGADKLTKLAKELSRRYMNHLIHLYNSRNYV